jgi:protein SCO1/2
VRKPLTLRAIGYVLTALALVGAADATADVPVAPETAAPPASIKSQSPDMQAALAASRASLGRQLGNYTLTNRDGRPVHLAALRGQPLVVNMIYTSCFDFCPTLTANLAPKVEIAREALGRGKFRVLTIGFDARNDTPERMHAYAHMLGVGDSEWLFLSGDEQTIAALAHDLGFTYRRTTAGFDHSALTTIVNANGRVYRQIYGTDYAVPALVEPLKALVLGAQDPTAGLSQLMERVRLWCTRYDPRTGRYRFDYALILSAVIGSACLAAFGGFIAREWRRSRRAARNAAAS